MTPEQVAALAAVAGRPLTEPDKAALDPLVTIRNDVEIALLLSIGRSKHGPTQIGPGTVIAVMGHPRGGMFLDAVAELGNVDRTVYWGMDPVRRGALDMSIPAARQQLIALKGRMEEFAPDIDKLLLVGVVPDPIAFATVSDVLNKAEGRMTP